VPRRGAHVTGIDNSPEQLKTAERLMKEYELEVDFIHGNAEDVPYPDASFDFAINETVKYVQDRKAFGNRIMDFQNTRFKLAECKTKAELLRSFVNDGIARLEVGELDAATASMAKWWGSQTQNEVMHECLQLHGGYGFMMEFPIARLYADSRVQMIYGGTNEIMKELIARSMDV
jgi:alkylation response protein AidB-like acyl-CoA dehydrogenase